MYLQLVIIIDKKILFVILNTLHMCINFADSNLLSCCCYYCTNCLFNGFPVL